MKIAILAGVAAAFATAPAAAVTLDFDQFAGSSQIASDGGFDFTNLFALDTVGYPASGYVNGVKSGPNVAYNGSGGFATVSAPTAFSLTSGYLAAAWNDGLTVQLVGTLAGAAVFTQSFVVDTSKSVFEAFNPALVDKVVFTSFGGTHHAGYDAGLGTQMSLDDLTINGSLPVVPEPATWALMIVGFGLVGGSLRRRTPRTA